MRLVDAVKKLLEDAGVADVLTAPPSVAVCAEPVIVARPGYERDAKLTDGDRRRARVDVLVCRESDTAAQDAALECERKLQEASWESVRDVKGGQIRGCSVAAPEFKERDGSGRYVYAVGLEFTIKRDSVR